MGWNADAAAPRVRSLGTTLLGKVPVLHFTFPGKGTDVLF